MNSGGLLYKDSYPKVSIIVPAYKVEQYLKRCLDSIVSQTYKNMEVILVDDGSPDNCGEICDQYAERYPFISVLHQTNQGQAAARNNAVRTARGKYITFVDSDDYVEPDYLEYLIGLMETYGTDMSIGGFVYEYGGKKQRSVHKEEKTMVMDPCEAIIRMNYNKGFGATPWAKAYKRDLIEKHPFPKGQIYEDLAVLYKIVGDCESVAFGNKVIYHWIQRAGSTMRMRFDERQMAGMDAVEAQLEYVKDRFPEALSSAKYRYTAKAVELMAVCFNSGGEKNVFRRLRSMMFRYAGDVLIDKRSKKTMKVRIAAASLGYYPAKAAFMLHERAKKKLI